jgi:adenosine/AMP kinase
MELKFVDVDPSGFNLVLGQSHFIKTVEDVYEAIVSSSPSIKFGVAFCEASGDSLIRYDGNDPKCQEKAVDVASKVGAGHLFVLVLKDSYPINIMEKLRAVPEVVTLFCASANPVQVVVAETDQGRGVLGVIDGGSPKGVEKESDKENRRVFLRKIGYKR